MSNWAAFRRIVIEETIRLMCLEVVIGLTPIGIASAQGVDVPMLYVIAGISLSIPLVIWVLMIVIRTRKKEEPAQVRTRWRMDKRAWIVLGVGVIMSILLTLFYSTKGLINERDVVASILIAFICIGIAAWFTFRRNRQ